MEKDRDEVQDEVKEQTEPGEGELNIKPDWKRTILMIVVLLVTVVALIVDHYRGRGMSDGTEDSSVSVIESYQKCVEESDYFIHALGGIGEDSYINSIDCLKQAYDAGYRLFEADISFTSDGVLVLAHSGENNIWSKNDWEKRLGQVYPFDDEGKHLCTYDEFMSFRIQGKYKACDLSELLDYMEEHKDMYLMVDAGCRSYEDTLTYYKEIVRVADGRTDVLNRLIAGGQTTEMVRAAREVYDFPIINLYYASDEKREEVLSTPEKFVEYCKAEGIISYSAASEVYTDEVAAVLGKSGLTGHIFTINDKAEAQRILELGADTVGTDFLWEEN